MDHYAILGVDESATKEDGVMRKFKSALHVCTWFQTCFKRFNTLNHYKASVAFHICLCQHDFVAPFASARRLKKHSAAWLCNAIQTRFGNGDLWSRRNSFVTFEHVMNINESLSKNIQDDIYYYIYT